MNAEVDGVFNWRAIKATDHAPFDIAVRTETTLVGQVQHVIGALAFVPAGKVIPNRSVGVGNPVKIVKEVTDKMLDWKTDGTLLYQNLAKSSHHNLKEVEPLRVVPKDRKDQEHVIKPWNETK